MVNIQWNTDAKTNKKIPLGINGNFARAKEVTE
jgi:hypothetical protein